METRREPRGQQRQRKQDPEVEREWRVGAAGEEGGRAQREGSRGDWGVGGVSQPLAFGELGLPVRRRGRLEVLEGPGTSQRGGRS